MRVDVAGIFNYRPQAIEDGTANRFGPAKRRMRFHAIEINTGGICAGSVPEGIPSGSRQHHRTSKSLQKPPTSIGAKSHQKTNLAPAWNANGVLPGATWLIARKPAAVLAAANEAESSGVQTEPNAPPPRGAQNPE